MRIYKVHGSKGGGRRKKPIRCRGCIICTGAATAQKGPCGDGQQWGVVGMLCILTCAVAAAAARNTRGARSTKGGQNVRRQRRPSLVAIEHAYNLSKASAGREAIDEAVLFVANEERAGATLGARAADEVARLLRAKQTAPGADEVAPLLRPGREVCAVTKKTLREDGVYLYRGDDAVVPYAHDCWILRARYHTAPGCEPKTAGVGRAAGAPPVWAWHWTVRDAAQGKCSLPDTRDPALAAASYLRLTNRRPRSGRKLTLVLLGLSYMGQPFISLGCKAARYLDGGASKVRTRIKTAQEEPQWRPIHTVRSEPNATRPAVCTGFVRHDVPKWYPAPTHNNQPPPVQRPLTCTVLCGNQPVSQMTHRSTQAPRTAASTNFQAIQVCECATNINLGK